MASDAADAGEHHGLDGQQQEEAGGEDRRREMGPARATQPHQILRLGLDRRRHDRLAPAGRGAAAGSSARLRRRARIRLRPRAARGS
jgi:hypothetical protein